jgi:hypothetical protein
MMNEEIKRIEDLYLRNLKKLNDVFTKSITDIQRSKMKSKSKTHYNNHTNNWYCQQKTALENVRSQNICDQQTKYTKIEESKKKKACLVGINYTGTENQLQGCMNDVQKMKNLLILKYGYDPRNIQLITEATLIKPTRKNIILQFANLLKNATAGDTLVFFFSGHGYHIPDMNNDEADGFDEIIITSENHYIVDDEFKAIIQSYLRPDVQLFGFFDSCHSGTIFDLRFEYLIDENLDQKTCPQTIETPGQVILLSSCRDEQQSVDANINGTFNGAMTFALVDILSKPKEDVTWYEVFKTLRLMVKQMGFAQVAQMSTGRDLDIRTSIVEI